MIDDNDVTWKEAPASIIHTAELIIGRCYPNLREARIGFVCRNEGQRVQGLYKFGGTQKVSDREKILLDLDFLIWMGERDWNQASDETREAMLDHLLAYCGGFPDAWKINQPEIREFATVISRRGFWNKQLLGIETALNSLVENQGQMIAAGFDRLYRQGAVVQVKPEAMQAANQEQAA